MQCSERGAVHHAFGKCEIREREPRSARKKTTRRHIERRGADRGLVAVPPQRHVGGGGERRVGAGQRCLLERKSLRSYVSIFVKPLSQKDKD